MFRPKKSYFKSNVQTFPDLEFVVQFAMFKVGMRKDAVDSAADGSNFNH